MTQEEISVVYSKTDLVALLSNEAVSEWLKSRQKEGTRSWKMRYGETNMGNRHSTEMAVNELERENEEEEQSTIVLQTRGVRVNKVYTNVESDKIFDDRWVATLTVRPEVYMSVVSRQRRLHPW